MVRNLLAAVVVFFGMLTAAKAQEVTCASAGTTYQIGDVVCIPACHGQQRLARCDLVSDAPTWTYLSTTCPSAMIRSAPLLAAWSTRPGLGAMTPIPARNIASGIAAGMI